MKKEISIMKCNIKQVTNGYVTKVTLSDYTETEIVSNSMEGVLVDLFKIQETVVEINNRKDSK